MKSYKEFLLEKLNSNQETILKKILDYLSKNNVNLYEYSEEFDVSKPNLNLTGKLYFLGNKQAIRFNFYKNTNDLNSIDFWNDFYFINSDEICNQPSKTLEIKTNIFKNISINLFKYFNAILKFIKGENINEEVETTETSDIETDMKVETPKTEKVDLKNLNIYDDVLNNDIDQFEIIKLYCKQVAFKISNSCLITGRGGVGKTTVVEESLDETNRPYERISGDITPFGLYDLLFKNRKSLLLFDDCDSVWENPESVSYLKSCLDTKPKRKISNIKKNYFNAIGLNDDEIDLEYKKSGKIPNQFTFEGQIIFISNLPEKKFDPNVLTRCLHVNVILTEDEVIERMWILLNKIFPNVSKKEKEEVLNFIEYFTKNFNSKFPLNIRSLIHGMNIRISNNYNTKINDKSIPVWQLLLKQHLLKVKV